jgi:hypothetical protein
MQRTSSPIANRKNIIADRSRAPTERTLVQSCATASGDHHQPPTDEPWWRHSKPDVQNRFRQRANHLAKEAGACAIDHHKDASSSISATAASRGQRCRVQRNLLRWVSKDVANARCDV